MGRAQADSSEEQPQEYDLQPQEYQYEPTSTQSFGTNYYESTQQDPYQSHFTETCANDPQQQQDYQQTPQSQPQQAPQYPPPPPPSQAANQGYGPQPAQPAQFPPRSGLNNSAYPPPPPSRPAPFPPQSSNLPTAYPPQTIPIQPVQFPPASSQTNPVYQNGPNKPAAYPPQHPQQMTGQPISGNYPAQVSPQPFPPQNAFTRNAYQAPQPQAASFPPQNNAGQGYNMASSPYKPAVQTPVAAQGFPVGQQVQYGEGWRTGLFDCMDDPMNALTTACFPCITFGQVAEIIDNGQTSCGTTGLLYGLVLGLIGLPCIMSCSYRTKLRAKYGLVEAPAADWVTHFFCEWCALCQEYRELQRRGLDPAIGWQGNMMLQQQQQPQVAMMPPMNQKMMP
ncbi:basic salivary proline-rich protein 3 [Ricinus communis]|uniref:Structural constituent of cell wall, putative n=1 Tax=Ricinus communis TaxID=3988 RepID=B9RE27_RICCO|nr:basic salivary proline-rich protein 3 [Ricinus communis]EEF50635.1 structural constituent of cell wall, putative [Ricinus communis]|eukprot:XP_002511966.1 basic salivary proline-rich protein 3 [Ricinus communis]